MSYPSLGIGIVLAFGWWVSLTTALAESRHALVIGNSAYQTVPALPNPANDARAITEFLKSAGFEVTSVNNLTLSDMRQAISQFADTLAGKGSEAVAAVYYAGHGLQVDGENFLVPIDANIVREADVPLQALRLVDLMNSLAAIPSKSRIVMLDACRNNPFSEINKVTGRGLAIVDAPPGTIISYATSPGSEALDGDGSNSPYTTAILAAAKEQGLPIEQAFKRVRYAVNSATNKQQLPWESSSLTSDFSFFPGSSGTPQVTQASIRPTGAPAVRAASRSVDAWKRELQRRPAPEAYEIVIKEDSVEAYQAYLALFSTQPDSARVRAVFDRRRVMIAWYTAVTLDTPASYQAFLASYGDTDLAATARRLLERAKNRSLMPTLAATCPCALPVPPAPIQQKAAPPPPPEKKAAAPTKKKTAKKEKKEKPTKRTVRTADPEPAAPPPQASAPPIMPIGIGIGIMGIGGGRGIGGGGYPSGGRVPSGGVRQPTPMPTGTHRY
jgi:caspase domain-containing protein